MIISALAINIGSSLANESCQWLPLEAPRRILVSYQQQIKGCKHKNASKLSFFLAKQINKFMVLPFERRE